MGKSGNSEHTREEEFKDELAKHRIKPIYGRPYHPRKREDRRMPQNTLQGADSNSPILLSITLLKRVEKVRQEIQLLEETTDPWMEDPCKYLQRQDTLTRVPNDE